MVARTSYNQHMAQNDILAFNDFAKINEKLGRVSKKSGKRGKSGISIRIDAEPVMFDLTDATLMKAIAERYTEAVRKGLATGGDTVTDSTADARAVSERAYSTNKRWAQRRFTGGRTKDTAPSPAERSEFKHSGRLEKSLNARYVPKLKAWVINVAANRLRRETFGTEAQYRNFLNRLLAHIPAMDTRKFMKSSEAHREMGRWIDHAATVVAKNSQLKAARRKAVFAALKAAKGLF